MRIVSDHQLSQGGEWLTEMRFPLFGSKHLWNFYGSRQIVFTCFSFSLEPKHKEPESSVVEPMPGVPVISRLHIQTTLQRGRNFKMSLWPFCHYFQNELSAIEYDLPSRVHLMVNEQLSTYLTGPGPLPRCISLLLHLWVTADADAPCPQAPFCC